MDDWEKFDERSLPEKEDFYSHLNLEDITDVDYTHGKEVFKDFEIKKIRRISWFIWSKQFIIVSRCVSENFRKELSNICLEIYEPEYVRFLTAPELA